MFLVQPLEAAPVPKGDRVLGLSVAAAQDGDYARALTLAQAAGVQSVTLSLEWPRLEPSPGRIDQTWLKIADGFYPPRHIQVDLLILPINTLHSDLPVDLAGRAFDDPEVIGRFERLLDVVFAATPHLTLHSLVIGSEVDTYLAAHSGQWKQYDNFYQSAAAYARSHRPGLKVAVAATYSGLTGASKNSLRLLNRPSDLIAATYYPLNADFTVRDPAAPLSDLAHLCELYPNRPVELTEAGYPSSPACHSSEAAQAQFVRSLFTAWDAHAAQIQSITLSWETDTSPVQTAEYVHYFGIGGDAFAGYLASIGLRTYSGSDKPAFVTLAREAHARGW